jgi:hypothetical protein
MRIDNTLILLFGMLGLGDAITREDIKEMLSTEFKVNIEKDGGDIAFITYEKGGAEALVSRRILFSTSVFRVQRF